jgi:hypothetical protein
MPSEPKPEGNRGPGGRRPWRWLLFNGALLALYLALEIGVLVPRTRSEAFEPVAIFIFWCTRLLPILVVAWVANLIWAVRVAKGPEQQRNREFAWWLGVFLVWCAALAYKGAGILLRIL